MLMIKRLKISSVIMCQTSGLTLTDKNRLFIEKKTMLMIKNED